MCWAVSRTWQCGISVGLGLAVSIDGKTANPRGCEKPKDVGREERRLGDPFAGDSGGARTDASLAQLRLVIGFHEGCHRRELEKLITDGGRYTKYHPNVMLALFASHGDAQSGHVPSGGLAESKFEEFKVVASTSTTPAERAQIRSGAVTAEELRQYAYGYLRLQPMKT